MAQRFSREGRLLDGSRASASARPRKVQLWFLAAIVTLVVFSMKASKPPTGFVPMERSLLRHLARGSVAGLVGSWWPLGAAKAEEQSYKEGLIQIGFPFQVAYPGPIPSDDFYIGGGEAEFGAQSLTNPKVVYVKPESRAYAQGLRVGDELTSVWKDDVYAFYSEGQLRRMKGVDTVLKKAAAAPSFLGLEAPMGLKMEFIATGVVQPGDPAPDFTLPASSGGELSLSELLNGNEYLVVFFRPGSRFRGGDLQEVRLFGRATKALAERGATVVGIQMEPIGALAAQAKGLDLSFPLLCDYDGRVAKAFGAYLELEEQGPNIDRKTFIIGKDGKIKTSFVDVGYDADKNQLVRHVTDVVRILGGDPKKTKEELAPRSKTLGEMLDIAVGNTPPTPKL